MSDILPTNSSSSPIKYSNFTHAELAITRFPPNIEQVSVKHCEDGIAYLTARQNNIKLEFRLNREDRKHLMHLLSGQTLNEQPL